MLVGHCNVGTAHKFFASPPYAFRDGFAYALRSRNSIVKDQNVKEEESARNDLAFSKSFLGSIATLLSNVFDAGGGTIMVMVE